MNKKPIIIIIVILLLAIIGVWGFMSGRNMPQVSENDSKKILIEYKNDLEELYVELNRTYEQLKVDKDKTEWENFSNDWMPRLVNVRSRTLDKEFPGEYQGKKDMLIYAQEQFIPLWNEYNKTFIGKNINSEKIEELKSAIENIFENVNV